MPQMRKMRPLEIVLREQHPQRQPLLQAGAGHGALVRTHTTRPPTSKPPMAGLTHWSDDSSSHLACSPELLWPHDQHPTDAVLDVLPIPNSRLRLLYPRAPKDHEQSILPKNVDATSAQRILPASVVESSP